MLTGIFHASRVLTMSTHMQNTIKNDQMKTLHGEP